MQREYEMLVLVDPEVDDEKVDAVVDRITEVLTGAGGEVTGVDRWGRRKLAYELENKTEGIYLVVTFRSETQAVNELDRVLSLADEVTRFKVVRKAA